MAGSKKKPRAPRAKKSSKRSSKDRAGSAERCDAAIRAAHEELTGESLASLRAVLERAARGTIERPLFVLAKPNAAGEAEPESWNRHLIDPAIVEVALELGLPLRLPKGAPESYTFWLYSWGKRALPEDALERVAAHPFFGRVLIASFMPTRETKDSVSSWLERAVTLPSFEPVFDALAERAAAIAESWTLGALEVHEDWVEGLCQPAVLRRKPAIAEAIAKIDAARLLRNQLRAGVLDEWGWPALDDALDRIAGEPGDWFHTTGPFPHYVLHSAEAKRVIVVGPDGVVLDRPYAHPEPEAGIRAVWYCEGDVLAISWKGERGHWVVAGGEPFATDAYGFYEIGRDGALVTRGDRLLHAGDRSYQRRPDGRGAGRRAWFDGRTWFDVTQETVLDRDGRAAEEKNPPDLYTFEPETGSRTGASLPDWMRGLLKTPDARLYAHIDTTFVCPVPARAARSPMGAKDGLGGFALYTHQGEMIAERIDGRRAPGLVNGKLVAGLVTFPERDALYPVIESAFELGVAMPDGTTPLVPLDGLRGGYWAGTAPLHMLYWHLLAPRQPAASRALAACSDEAARAILDAATAPDSEPERVMDYGDMQAVLVAAPKALAVTPALAKAITRALPAVQHPRIVAGVGALAGIAARLAPVVARLKSHLRVEVSESPVKNADVKALAKILDHDMPWWVEKLGTQLGQQMLDVSRYLFEGRDDEPQTPARTVFPWELMLTRIGEVLYRVLASATPKSVREELVRATELWRATAFPANAARVRLVSFTAPPSEVTAGLDREHTDRLITLENRYFVRFRGQRDGRLVVRAVEATRDGIFRLPPGAKLLEATAADARFDERALDRALALLRERGRVEAAPELVARVAARTKLCTPAAALLWGAGYDPWLVGNAARDRLGIDREGMEQADVQLRSARLRELYARAMPDDPEDMYGPVGADRVADAWNAEHGAGRAKRAKRRKDT